MANDLMSIYDNFFDNKHSFIGFDDFFKDLSIFDMNLTEKGIKDSYPPYNVSTRLVNVAAETEKEPINEEHTFIEIACAGFKKNELRISFEDESILTVKGQSQKRESTDTKYHYKGIGTRMFERQWKLSNKLEFVKASYVDGILTIEFKPKYDKCNSFETLPIE